MDARIDLQFARFQKTHDPRVLAAVFDATAPELWRVAAHLCRDRHDAEDAVQSAFLAAIAAKDSWDAERPVLPWLLGLLANRVREQRRAAARVVDAARLGERAGERDPAAVAQDREFGGAFVRALAAVDEPFRSVVERHLVHGQAAVDIAQEMGVPAATVRTRLHRGLEQLRQRLPTGVVAMGVVPAVMPREALAAMREQVVAAVPGGGVVAGAAAVGGWSALLMTKVALAVCAALVVMGVVGSRVLMDRAPQSAPAEVTGVASATGSHAVAADRTIADAPPAPQSAVPLEREPVVSAAPGVGTLRVLVRSAETQQPIAGVMVQARHRSPRRPTASPSTNEVTSLPATSTATAPDSATGTTDTAGVVLLQLVAGPAVVAAVSAKAKFTDAVVRPDTVTECTHDIEASFVADVRVVDSGKNPIANAAIVGVRNPNGVLDGVDLIEELGRTDAAGRWRSWRIEHQLVVRAVREGRATSKWDLVHQGRTVELQIGGPAVPVVGSVVGPDSAAVPGALVAFVPSGMQVVGPPWSARTDALGQFRCSWFEAGRHRVLVNEGTPGRGRFLLKDVDLGASEPLTLTLPRGASVHAKLRRHDGAPCANVSVGAQLVAAELSGAIALFARRDGRTNGNGEITLDGLMPGRYRVSADAGHEQFEQFVELRDGEQRVCEHAFGAETQLVVEVVDEHGTPRDGVAVHLAGANGNDQSLTTGVDGRVRYLGVAPGTHEVTLGGDAHGLHWSRHEVSTAAVARVVAPRNVGVTRVHGRLVAAAGTTVPRGAQVQLVPLRDDGPLRREQARAEWDAATGVFVVQHVPPGRFVLSAADPMNGHLLGLHGPIEVKDQQEIDLGDVQLGTGRVDVGLRAAFAIEAPRVHLAGLGTSLFVTRAAEAKGELVSIDHVPPGRSRVLAWGANVCPAVTEIEVGIGGTATAAVALAPGVRTQLLLPDEVGVLTIVFPDSSRLRLIPAGERQFVRGFAPGNYHVEHETFSRRRLAADFTVGTEPGAPIELLPVPSPR
jgi:RNA polymerase sigma-70 factor (ECF subfamily)